MSEKIRKIRIGIDVGGTFTDAVAVDSEDFSIIASAKVPTTHAAESGVAQGVIDSLHAVIREGNIDPTEISFIAHGTTQATNALLEGDVAKVGILGMGSNIEGLKAKSDTVLGDVDVSEGKQMHTVSVFLDTKDGVPEEDALKLIQQLEDQGSEVIVASEAFSVDHPENEQEVQRLARGKGLYATGGHEISRLYGLKARTRTAAINASILPKMINTADKTQQAVIDAQIQTPLMIMRCDGGVMKIDEIRSRPILTILSGPAAGVAGALMYERVSDGIFLEVGGTSTDISAIKNGKVMVNYAEVGGHKTYVTSLDVRTIGIGGGSMIRVDSSRVKDVGPRSAHIAHCGYCVYADTDVIRGGRLELISPLPGDPAECAVIVGTAGKRYAITQSCIANLSGLIPDGDYAQGNLEAARAGVQHLADYMHTTVEKIVDDVINISSGKAEAVVKKLFADYGLDKNTAILAGGGGGASVVLWALAKRMDMQAKLAKNAPIISTIGAALAMVRDVVERTMVNPTEDDLLRLRKEAEHLAIESGANPETVEVNIEIDTSLNRVRAIAVGTTELVRKTLGVGDMEQPQIQKQAAEAVGLADPSQVKLLFSSNFFYAYQAQIKPKGFLAFIKGKKNFLIVLDKKGIVKLKLEEVKTEVSTASQLMGRCKALIKQYAAYDESGERAPDVFLLVRGKIVEFKGIPTIDQLAALIQAEVRPVDADEPVSLIIKEKL